MYKDQMVFEEGVLATDMEAMGRAMLASVALLKLPREAQLQPSVHPCAMAATRLAVPRPVRRWSASQPSRSLHPGRTHDSDPIGRKIDARRQLESEEEFRLGRDLALLERACERAGAPRPPAGALGPRSSGPRFFAPPLLAGSGAMRGPRLDMSYAAQLSRLARVSPAHLEERALAGFTTAQLARLAGYANHEYAQLRARFLQRPSTQEGGTTPPRATGAQPPEGQAFAKDEQREEPRTERREERVGYGCHEEPLSVPSLRRPSSAYDSMGRRAGQARPAGRPSAAGSGRVAVAALSTSNTPR